MPHSLQFRRRICHAALPSLAVDPNALMAATVGSVQKVDFSPTVVSRLCDFTTTAGSLAVEKSGV
jgi:hypothetical protein